MSAFSLMPSITKLSLFFALSEVSINVCWSELRKITTAIHHVIRQKTWICLSEMRASMCISKGQVLCPPSCMFNLLIPSWKNLEFQVMMECRPGNACLQQKSCVCWSLTCSRAPKPGSWVQDRVYMKGRETMKMNPPYPASCYAGMGDELRD